MHSAPKSAPCQGKVTELINSGQVSYAAARKEKLPSFYDVSEALFIYSALGSAGHPSVGVAGAAAGRGHRANRGGAQGRSESCEEACSKLWGATLLRRPLDSWRRSWSARPERQKRPRRRPRCDRDPETAQPIRVGRAPESFGCGRSLLR